MSDDNVASCESPIKATSTCSAKEELHRAIENSDLKKVQNIITRYPELLRRALTLKLSFKGSITQNIFYFSGAQLMMIGGHRCTWLFGKMRKT